MAENMSAYAGIRRGLWSAADCDLDVLSHVPPELALCVVAGILVRNRDELARQMAGSDEDPASIHRLLTEIPNLSPTAEALRHRKLSGPPRREALDRLGWALRRAAVFLESFAPPGAVHDAVMADRILDLTIKVSFLVDLVDGWRAPGTAARRKTG